MRCLNEVEIQAVADGEASGTLRAHAGECRQCGERVHTRLRDLKEIGAALSAARMSPAFETRMRRTIDAGAPARGATTLRAPSHRGHRRAWISAGLAAAATALAVFVVLPKLGAPTSLSASEVLGRSLETITDATGVELLEYDLFLAGAMSRSHRIEHLIDHDVPGRFRFTNYGPDGTLVSSIGHDPSTGRRFFLARANGQGMMIDVAPGAAPNVSLPEMMQALIETSITMMQATHDPTLSERDGADGRQYVVEMPAASPRSSAAVIDLFSARVVVDADDFRIHEFEANGSILRQPYTVAFRLLRRTSRPSADVPPEEFDPPVGAADVIVDARADHDPLTDVLTALVREVHRGR